MKRLYLLEVDQYIDEKYIASISSDDLFKLAPKDLQEKILKATLNYEIICVKGKIEILFSDGLLYKPVPVEVNKEKVAVTPSRKGTTTKLFYIDFPKTKKEFEEFKSNFNIRIDEDRLIEILAACKKIYLENDRNFTFDVPVDLRLKSFTPKHKEVRDLAEKVFENTNMKPVISSSIKRVGYDEMSSLLYVEFQKGAVYVFADVDEFIFTEFVNSASPGTYFNCYIKGLFVSRRLK